MSTSLFDKWGLSPQERRFVVIVAVVVFILINWWVIIPMFGDWGRYNQRISDTGKLVDKYKAEIQKKAEYERQLRELQRTSGQDVASEEAALRLHQEVINNANLTGLGYGTITPVNRSSTAPTSTKTNFFDEASVNVSINTGEKELIDFLVRLADKDLLIRAKSMDIGPDQSQTRLQGNLTLVKSFQRKQATRAGAPVAAKPAAAVTPPPSTTPVPLPTSPQTNQPPKVEPRATMPPATSSPPPKVTAPGPNTNATGVPARTLPKQLK